MLHEAELYSVAVWAIFLGIVFSIFYISIQKKSIGQFISRLIELESFDEITAKSLDELGITSRLAKNVIYNGVKKQHGLIRIIGFKNKTIIKAPQEFCNFSPDDSMKFYISKMAAEDSAKKYISAKSNRLYITICIIVLFIIASIASIVISKLTTYAGNVFNGYTSYKPKQEDVVQNEKDKTENETDSNKSDNTADENMISTEDNDESVYDLTVEEDSTNDENKHTQIKPTIPKGPLS